jgi:hypothetical protein
MKIESEKNRYHGDAGGDSDPKLFAQVVTWKQWIGHADEHLHAAQVLLPYVQQRHAEIQRLMESRERATVRLPPCLTGIYFLHCAFSIENAFRCVIAARSASEIEAEIGRTNRIPKILLGHDLLELARKASFNIGTDEEYTLVFLSRYGTWAGRYPLPVHNRHNALTDQLSNGGHYLMAGYRLDQVPAFVAFAASIYAWARVEVEARETELSTPGQCEAK